MIVTQQSPTIKTSTALEEPEQFEFNRRYASKRTYRAQVVGAEWAWNDGAWSPRRVDWSGPLVLKSGSLSEQWGSDSEWWGPHHTTTIPPTVALALDATLATLPAIDTKEITS